MDVIGSNVSLNLGSCDTTGPEDVWTNFAQLTWETIYGICVSVVAISANLIVIVCLWGDSNTSMSGFSTYAISMAFTDLLVGVVLAPVTAIITYWCFWPLGIACCFIWKCLDHGLTSVSMLLFLAMGYDRYRCVTAPLLYRSQFRRNRAARISFFVWIGGFLLWIPYVGVKILFLDVEIYKISCPVFNFRVSVFEAMQLTIVYYMPTLALIAMNIVLLWALNRRMQLTFSRSQKQIAGAAQEHTNISVVNSCQDVNKHSEVRGRRRPTTMRCKLTLSYKIILMVIVFCLFWLPFFVLWPLNGVCGGCVPDWMRALSGVLTYGQSALNPLIVIFTSRQIPSRIAHMCHSR